jgi:annexin A7/11
MAESSFNAHHDAEIIHKAVEGMGTDEKAINKVLGHRNKHQIQEIAKAYEAAYKATLLHDIKGDTSGNYKRLLVSLINAPVQNKKELILKATKGLGTTEKYLIDVLAPSSNEEIIELYQNDPKIIHAIIDDVSSGNFAKVVETVLKGKRDERDSIPDDEAAAQAEKLYKAGEGKLGTDEKVFNEIITHYSAHALKQISKHYESKHKHGLDKAVKSETSGNYEDLLVALLKTRHEYFADRLYDAIAGLGTDDTFLIYAFGVLPKHDVHKVAHIFNERHPKRGGLAKAVKEDTSGDYGELLMEILSE